MFLIKFLIIKNSQIFKTWTNSNIKFSGPLKKTTFALPSGVTCGIEKNLIFFYSSSLNVLSKSLTVKEIWVNPLEYIFFGLLNVL